MILPGGTVQAMRPYFFIYDLQEFVFTVKVFMISKSKGDWKPTEGDGRQAKGDHKY
jgi:hypothetical protein